MYVPMGGWGLAWEVSAAGAGRGSLQVGHTYMESRVVVHRTTLQSRDDRTNYLRDATAGEGNRRGGFLVVQYLGLGRTR